MERLNIYVNKYDSYEMSGLLVVAAHNIKEADKVCINNEKLEHLYWHYDDNNNKVPEDNDGYYKENFIQIPNAYFEGEAQVLAEH